MSHPLATLRRGSTLVAFHRWPPPAVLRFHARGDALVFLGFWARDAAAVFTLRSLLREALSAGPLFALSDAQVLDTLAACLVDGTISVAAPPASAALPSSLPAAAAAAEAPAAPSAPPAVLAVVAAVAAVADDVLEALEEVQIEGAEVRPEIEQALAELDVSLANVSLASVSLAPTPTKVDAISASMSQASTGAVQTIDGL